MTDHPINLKSWEVRAIIDGRKTMTRRLLKPQPVPFRLGADGSGSECEVSAVTLQDEKPRIALGRVITAQNATRWAPGDRLWVRERFSGEWPYDSVPPREWDFGGPIWYWADGNPDDGDWTKPKPSTQMPRWASRITLLVTDVRVERVQDISEADAAAEGAECMAMDDDGKFYLDNARGDHRTGFAGIWAHLHGPDAWDANPWVSVTKFERVT